VQGSVAVSRMKVSADGRDVVSHAGVGMLREVADLTGLCGQVTAALADTYRGPWTHAPGDVFADLAAAVADGADCVDGVGQLWGDREHAFGPVGSTTTLWRLVDERIDAARLPRIRAARAQARERAWAAGAAPAREGWLHIDVDATITVDHSDNKENAAATWKHTFGFHSLLMFLDRPDIAAGEALAGLLRAGNAGSNTTADHIAGLRDRCWNPRRGRHPQHRRGVVSGDPGRRRHPRRRLGGRGHRSGGPVEMACRHPADPAQGTPASRRAAAVHRCRWAPGHRVSHRHPQRRDRRPARWPGVAPSPTRPGGRPDPPSQGHRASQPAVQLFDANAAWLEIIMAATDLIAWTKLIGFTDHPDLARCEIETFRYRVLHIAARITRSARQLRLRIDSTWRWAAPIATAWNRIRTAFT